MAVWEGLWLAEPERMGKQQIVVNTDYAHSLAAINDHSRDCFAVGLIAGGRVSLKAVMGWPID